MTIPFTPSESEPQPETGAADGLVAGAAMSALNARTEANVRGLLQSQLQTDFVWGQLWDGFWELVTTPFRWLADILEKLFPGLPWEEILTLDIIGVAQWITDQVSEVPFLGDLARWVTGSLIGTGETLELWFSNLGSFLGHLNFLSPDFDLLAAAEDFINFILFPVGAIADMVGLDELGDAIRNIGAGITGFLSDSIQGTVETVTQWFGNLGGFFASINFLSPDFDILAAAESFIDFVLFPVGKIADMVGLEGLGDAIRNIGAGITGFLSSSVEGTVETLTEWFGNLGSFFASINFLSPDFDLVAAAEDFIDFILFPVGKIADMVGLNGLGDAIRNIGAGITGFLSESIEGTVETVGEWFGNLKDFFASINFLSPDFDLLAAAEDFIDFILFPVGKIADMVGLDGLSDAIRDIGGAITGFVSSSVQGTIDTIGDWFANLKSFFASINFLSADFDLLAAAEDFIDFILFPVGKIADMVGLDNVAQSIYGIGEAVTGFFNDSLTGTVETLTEWFGNLGGFLGSLNFLSPDFDLLAAAEDFIDFILFPVGKIADMVGLDGLGDAIRDIGAAITGWLSDSISGTITTVTEWFDNLREFFAHINFLSPSFDLIAAAEDFIDFILFPVGKIADMLSLNALGEMITELLQNLLNFPGHVIGSIGNVIMDGIKTVGDFLGGLWSAFTGQPPPAAAASIDEVTEEAAAVAITSNTAFENADTALQDAADAQDTADDAVALIDSRTIGGDNLVANPGFENSRGSAQGGQWWAAPNRVRTGSRSLRFTCDGTLKKFDLIASSGGGAGLLTSPGSTYFLELWAFGEEANTATTGTAVYLRAENTRLNGTVFNTYIGGVSADDCRNEWAPMQFFYEIPAETVSVRFSVVTELPAPNVVYVDDPIVLAYTQTQSVIDAVELGVNPEEWASGNSIDTLSENVASVLNVANLGVENAGEALEAAELAQDSADYAANLLRDTIQSGLNIVMNPSFENGGFLLNPGAGALVSYETDLDSVYAGSQSLRMESNGVNHITQGLVNDGDSDRLSVFSSDDDVYWAEFVVRASGNNSSSGEVNLVIRCEDTNGNWTYPNIRIFAVDVPTTSWAKVSGFIPVTAGTVAIEPYLQVHINCEDGDVYWFDAVKIVRATEAYRAQQDADKVAGDLEFKSQDFSNMIPGSDFSGPDAASNGWTWDDLAYSLDGGELKIVASNIQRHATYVGGGSNPEYYRVRPREKIYIEAKVRKSPDYVGESTAGPRFRLIRAQNSNTFHNLYLRASDIPAGAGPHTISTVGEVPDDGTTQMYIGILSMPAGTAGSVWIDDVVVRRVTPGIGIADEAITDAKIADETITPAKIDYLDGSLITSGQVEQARVRGENGGDLSDDLAARLNKSAYESFISGGNNLSTNPGFEDTTQYQLSGVELTTERARSGSRSAKVVGPGKGISVCNGATAEQRLNVSPGQSYYFEFWMWQENGTSTGGTFIRASLYENATFRIHVYPINFASSSAHNGKWTRFSGLMTIPEPPDNQDYSQMRVRIETNSNTPSNVVRYFDDFILREVTEAVATNQNLFDSDVPQAQIKVGAVPDLPGGIITSGEIAEARVQNLATTKATAYLAQSIADAGSAPGSNLCSNPGYENPDFYINTNPNVSYNTDADYVRTGSRSLKIVTNGSFIGTDNICNSSGPVAIPTRDGNYYYAEGWTRGVSGQGNGGNVYIQLAVYRDISEPGQPPRTTTSIGYLNVDLLTINSTFNDGWVKLSGIVQIPDGWNAYELRFTSHCHQNNTPGLTVYFDDVVLYDITEAVKLSQSLYGANEPVEKLLSATIPYLDGSIINSGLVPEQYVQNLPSVREGLEEAKARLAEAVRNGQNLMFDPSFEIDIWGNDSSTEKARTGSKSLRHDSGSNIGIHVYRDSNGVLSRWPSDNTRVYFVEAWVFPHANNAHTAGYISIHSQVLREDGTYTYPNVPVTLSTLTKNKWNRISGYLDFSDRGAVKEWGLYLRRDANTGNDIFWWDDVRVIDVTDAYRAQNAIDASNVNLYGSNTPSDYILTSRINSVDGSKITGTVAEARVQNLTTAKNSAFDAQSVAVGSLGSGGNLCPYSGFEDSSFYINHGEYYSSNSAYILSGSQSLKITSQTSTRSVYLTNSTTGAVYNTATEDLTVYMEAYVKADSGNSNVTSGTISLFVTPYRASKTAYSGQTVASVAAGPALKNTWTKISGFLQVRADAKYWRPAIAVGSTVQSGDVYYFDEVVVRDVSYASQVNRALYNNDYAQSKILSSSVPNLDSSIVTSGSFNVARIPNLAASKITSGSFVDARIPNLAATKITSGSFATDRIPGLDGSKITGGTVAEARVQNLTTTKNTANLAQATLDRVASTPNLVESPSFEDSSVDRIPYNTTTPISYQTAQKYFGSRSLRWTNSPTATWRGIYLAPTSTNTWYEVSPGETIACSAWIKAHGNYASSAGYVKLFMRWSTSGVSGYEDTNNGDNIIYNSNITTSWRQITNFGKCPEGRNRLQIFLINDPNVPLNHMYYVDNVGVYRLSSQSDVTGLPPGEEAGNETLAQTVARLGDDVADIKAELDVNDNVGKTIKVNFSDYGDVTNLATQNVLPDKKWSITNVNGTTYTGATWGTSYNVATFTGNTSSGSGTAKIIYLGDTSVAGSEKTLTDFQKIKGVLATPPGGISTGGPAFTALGRVSDDGKSYVWARAQFTSPFTLRGSMGYAVNGTETTWVSNIPLSWSLEMTFILGVDGNARKYQVYSGSTLVKEYTESGTSSRLGGTSTNYRRFGAIVSYSGGQTSGTISSVTVSDNSVPAFKGSVGRMVRTSTTSVTQAGGIVDIPAGFFADTSYSIDSLSVTVDESAGTFKVSKSGMYAVAARIKINADIDRLVSVVLRKSTNNGSTWVTVQEGVPVWPWDNLYSGFPGEHMALCGNWLQYLEAGDMVKLATNVVGGNTSKSLSIAGVSGGAETYFTISAL